MAKPDKKTPCYAALVQSLRDTSYLLNQTYIVHWNLIGCKFYSIHKLTESMYEELQGGLDTVAEHIRSLDIAAPKTVEDLNYSTLPRLPEDCFDQEGLIGALATNANMLAEKFADIAKQAGAIGDDLTLDLAVERARAHKKYQWLLKSNLGC
jgi:starvation-inducible DNA-binding protein